MRPPDIRGQVIERVLELAAAAGVDDVQLIAATSLHRRMSAAELREILGERVFRSFWPDALACHDAEDTCNLVCVGRTQQGELVELNRRAVESDLLVYININLVPMDGGHKSVPVGLASYRSLRHHHNVETLLASRSYMDPPHSALHASAHRMGQLLGEHLRVFTVETTLDNRTFPSRFEFLNTREWEWSVRDQLGFVAARQAALRAPVGGAKAHVSLGARAVRSDRSERWMRRTPYMRGHCSGSTNNNWWRSTARPTSWSQACRILGPTT